MVPRKDASHRERFQELDRNNDGRPELDEMADATFEGFKFILPEIEDEVTRAELEAKYPDQKAVFDQLDINGDGKLKPFEVKTWARDKLKDQFIAADRNDDSLVTLEEFLAYHKA